MSSKGRISVFKSIGNLCLFLALLIIIIEQAFHKVLPSKQLAALLGINDGPIWLWMAIALALLGVALRGFSFFLHRRGIAAAAGKSRWKPDSPTHPKIILSGDFDFSSVGNTLAEIQNAFGPISVAVELKWEDLNSTSDQTTHSYQKALLLRYLHGSFTEEKDGKSPSSQEKPAQLEAPLLLRFQFPINEESSEEQKVGMPEDFHNLYEDLVARLPNLVLCGGIPEFELCRECWPKSTFLIDSTTQLRGPKFIELIDEGKLPAEISNKPAGSFQGFMAPYSRILEYPQWVKRAQSSGFLVYASDQSFDEYPALTELTPEERKGRWQALLGIGVNGFYTQFPHEAAELFKKA